MRRKLVLGMTLMIAIVGMLGVAFNVQRVEAGGTITIRADGSVDPSTANITTADNVTYTFTANINDSIVVQRDNIVVDGAGYILQGTGSGNGIDLRNRSNVTVKNMEIKEFYNGIFLDQSPNNSISENNITNNNFGIGFGYTGTSNITISGNNIRDNGWGITLAGSNKIYHNNFINNTGQVAVTPSTTNTWDDGYPSGGNYWSDYTGLDLYRGPYQNETGSDGIGDTPYVIDGNNQDNYPFMPPDTTPPNITDVSQTPPENNVLPEDEVKVNATVTDYVSGVKQVTLNYTNGNGTWIIISMTNLEGNVWNATILAFPYGTNVTYVIIAEDNANNTITTEEMAYEYQYQVIPEFPHGHQCCLYSLCLQLP